MYTRYNNFPGQWEQRSLIVFNEAVSAYIIKLNSLYDVGNETILKEIRDWKDIRITIRDQISGNTDLLRELVLNGAHYSQLHKILKLYLIFKQHQLNEKRKTHNEPVAFEGLEREISEIERLLRLDFWDQFEDTNIHVSSFIIEKNETSSSSQMTIGNFYNYMGMFALNNYGSMKQENEFSPVLNEIYTKIDKSDLEQDVKREYIADIATLQAQISGGKPNKDIVKTLLTKFRSAIAVGGDLATIGTLLLPHLNNLDLHFDKLF